MQTSVNLSSRVVIATHELYYGAAQALRDYLVRRRIEELVYISHPIRPENRQSKKEVYRKGKRVRLVSFRRSSGNALWWGADFVLTIAWSIAQGRRYGLFIGVDPLNCLAGLGLRALGVVRRVIFYSIDFTPKRFEQQIFNTIYHAIEALCVRLADIRWDVSPRIAQGRATFFGIKREDFPVTVVPVGVWEKDIVQAAAPFDPHRFVFVGHLLKKQGVEKVIAALPSLVKRVRDAHFLIIGGGEEEAALRRLARTLHMDGHVTFTGWVWDQEKVKSLLAQCAFAVAPYDPHGADEENFTYYADPTKIKTYLACGLPIITTDVPHNAQALSEAGCARIVRYETSAIARALSTWLTDKNALEEARNSALRQAHEYTWEKIFRHVID